MRRGSSLYIEHLKAKPHIEEDDPSKRAFDREKDIAGPSKLANSQKKEMLRKAADFDTRFAQGQYL